MTKAGDEIMVGINDAIDYMRGDKTKAAPTILSLPTST